MKYDVFISYSHKDHELVRSFENKLQAKGLTVFKDDQIVPACTFDDPIATAISNANIFLPVVTESYIESEYARIELLHALGTAKKSGLMIIPMLIEPVTPNNLPMEFEILIGSLQCFSGSFVDVEQKVLEVLVKDKRERTKAEILNRAFQNWNYGDYYEAEMDINDLLQDPVYVNDPKGHLGNLTTM